MANKRGKSAEPDEDEALASAQRIDKWLVFARIVKTRSIAQDLVETKKVRLNRDKIDNPARQVRAGDVLTISYSNRVHVLKVTGFAERRGSAAEAGALYEDLNESAAPAGDPGSRTERTDEEAVLIAEPKAKRTDPVQRDKDRRRARRERGRRHGF